MLLGVTFIGLQLGFVLVLAGWVLMMVLLGRHPIAFKSREPFSRWSQFMKGEGLPAEAQGQRKVIAWLFRAGLIILAVAFIAFFAAGGPDALEPPPQR